MKLVRARDLAQRSLGLVANAVNYVQASRAGTVPGPLWLLVHSANQLAERILAQPSPVATPAQRRTLSALAMQLRVMSSRIIITAEGQHSNSVEAELAELVRRTLELIERVSAEPKVIEQGNVIDVEVSEP